MTTVHGITELTGLLEVISSCGTYVLECVLVTQGQLNFCDLSNHKTMGKTYEFHSAFILPRKKYILIINTLFPLEHMFASFLTGDMPVNPIKGAKIIPN